MLEWTSALASRLAAGSRLRGGATGVRLGEVGGWGLLQVAGFAGEMASVAHEVNVACSLASPGAIGVAVRGGDVTVFRTGPEQFWIVGPGERLVVEAAIRAAVPASSGVVTSLSHCRARLFIEGPRARDMLAKEIAVDLDPGVFGVDRFALTGFDHTPVLLHRTGAERYEIYALRTFALTVWERLADAAMEWGYEVGV
jgi:methylglutamate dehydrogenase subunit D